MTNSFINIITLKIIIMMRMMINDVRASVQRIAEQSRRAKLSSDDILRRLMMRQTSERAHSVRGKGADDGGDGPRVVRGLTLSLSQTVNITLAGSQLYQFTIPAGVTV